MLAEDRSRKLEAIAEMRKRIAFWQEVPASDLGGEFAKKGKLVGMHKHLEGLKILADVNDPVIKKRFEDGMGQSSPYWSLTSMALGANLFLGLRKR